MLCLDTSVFSYDNLKAIPMSVIRKPSQWALYCALGRWEEIATVLTTCVLDKMLPVQSKFPKLYTNIRTELRFKKLIVNILPHEIFLLFYSYGTTSEYSIYFNNNDIELLSWSWNYAPMFSVTCFLFFSPFCSVMKNYYCHIVAPFIWAPRQMQCLHKTLQWAWPLVLW